MVMPVPNLAVSQHSRESDLLSLGPDLAELAERLLTISYIFFTFPKLSLSSARVWQMVEQQGFFVSII